MLQHLRGDHIYSINSWYEIYLSLSIMTSLLEHYDVRFCNQIETCKIVIKRLLFIVLLAFCQQPEGIRLEIYNS